MRLRDLLTIAALMLFIGATYAWMGKCDEESAQRDLAAEAVPVHP